MGGCGQCYDPVALPSGKRPSTNFTGRLMGFRVGLGECGISHPHRDSIHGPLYLYLVTIPSALSPPILRNINYWFYISGNPRNEHPYLIFFRSNDSELQNRDIRRVRRLRVTVIYI
jgi:hypothetical protein